jgi:hypothetical protein
MLSVAGILKEEYKLFAILSALLVITSILNYERKGYVIFFMSRSNILSDVVFSRSLIKCSVCVY